MPKDNINFIMPFLGHVRQHSADFEFAFAIGIYDMPGHFGMGAHTGAVLSTKMKGVYKRGLKVDFTDSGILVGTYIWATWGAKWSEQKGNESSYALWYNSISKDDMVNVLAEVVWQDKHPHSYNMMGFLPGKNLGQNCTTYAVKLARYAGFDFSIERIAGTNPLHLHRVLKVRKALGTHWKVKYRNKTR